MTYSDYIVQMKRVLGPKFRIETSDIGLTDEDYEAYLNEAFVHVSDYIYKIYSVDVKWTSTTQDQDITTELISGGWVYGHSRLMNITSESPQAFRRIPTLSDRFWSLREVNNKLILTLLRYWPQQGVIFTLECKTMYSYDRDNFTWPDKYYYGISRLAASFVGNTISAFYANKENTKILVDNIDYENKSRDWRLWSQLQKEQAYVELNIPKDGYEPSGKFVSMRQY